jgi:hypothetical protein
MVSIKNIVGNTKFKVFLLFILAFLPRIIGLGEHNIFVDEITWMSRCKDVYAAVRTLSWSPYNIDWWLTPNIAEAIGLPVTFLGGIAMTYLSPGYSSHSLNIVRDFVATRIPVAMIGTFFVPILYLLLRKFVNDKVAFVSSLLLAVDPVSIGLSRWLHHDVALVFFSVFSLFLYLISNRRIVVVASAFLASMAILTKPQGFLVVATLVIYSILTFIIKKEIKPKKLIGWTLLAAVFTTLFFPYLWKNPIGNMLYYLSFQVANVDLGNLTYFNGQITSNPPWYYYFAIFPFRVPESILFGLIVGLILFVLNIKKKIFTNKLVQVALIYSVLFIVAISLSSKKLGIRYLFGVWPYIYILAASGLVYIEKFISKPFKKVYWLIVFLFPIWGILKFYPIYYLYHNNFITPQNFQSLESVGYCDSVKPAIEYLEPKLYHGIKLMLPGCDAAINYYTGFTINRIYNVNDNPDFIIEEFHNAQKSLDIYKQIDEAGYKEIKQIDFREIILAKIYQKPK